MKLEILLATMNRKDSSLLSEMKICSDVIVCNQNGEKTAYEQFEHRGYSVRWYDFQEKGVGLNRNNGLMRATGDVCLMADDDLVYEPGYEKMILDAFERYADADVLLFNLRDTNGKIRSTQKKAKRVRLHNCGRYGAVRIAFRRLSVIKNAICFNQLFGGGAMFTAGEDTMFIRECIRKGLKVIAVPDVILTLVDKRPSTWFTGYDRKFFEDFGTSYCYHYHGLAPVCTFVQLIRRRKKWLTQYSLLEAWAFAREGIKKFKTMR